jgi:MYXO-CTERM domain-containing protein
MCLGILVSCGITEPEGSASANQLGRKSAALGTISTIVKFSGATGGCFSPSSCSGSIGYVCNAVSNGLTFLTKEFPDPVPEGALPVGVTAKVYGRLKKVGTAGAGTGNGDTGDNIDVYLNGDDVGTSFNAPVVPSCNGACDVGTTTPKSYPDGIDNYKRGDNNLLRVEIPPGAEYCVSHVELSFTYKPRSLEIIEVVDGPSFGNQKLSTTSPSKTVKVKNTGEAAVKSIIPSIAGPTGVFTLSSTTEFSLNPSEVKMFTVTFTPDTEEKVSGVLSFTSNETGYPSNPKATVTLSGTGVKSAVDVSPASLDFKEQYVGISSPPVMKVRVRNVGDSSFNVTDASITGPFEFTPTPSPVSPVVVPVNDFKDFSVTFRPGTSGLFKGNLTLTTNDDDRPTVMVPLEGTGLKPTLVVDGTLDFGERRTTTSTSLPLAISNPGTGTLDITNINLTGTHAARYSLSATSLTVPSKQSRTLTVTFNPTAEGLASATLNLTTNDPDSKSATVSLSGTGVKSTIELPNTLAFDEQRVTTSTTHVLTVTNSGTATLNISNITVTGTDAARYSISSNVLAVPAKGSQPLTVTFTPTAEGPTSATLNFTTDDPSKPNTTVTLSGTGVKPVLAVSTTPLVFSEQPVGSTSTAQKVAVRNSGTGSLSVSISLTGTHSTSYSVTPSTHLVPPNDTREFTVTFVPKVEDLNEATLILTSNEVGRVPVNISLTGTGVRPSLSVDTTSLSFEPQAVGTTSAAHKVKVSNKGTGTLRITELTVGNPFAVTPSLPFDLLAGASQELSVTFSPTALGTATGTLSIRTNAPATPSATVSLSGNGVSWIEMSPSDTLDFGKVRVGDTSSRTVTLTNTSFVNVQLQFRSSLAPPFTITGPSLPMMLPAHATATFTVTYSPTAKGEATTSFVVVSDAFNNPHELKSIKGTGVVAVAEISLPGNSERLATLDFGDVRLTTSKVRTVRLSNIGDAPLTFTQPYVSDPSPFSYIGPSTLTLQPKTYIDFQVGFKPTESIISNDTLIIGSNAENDPSLLRLVGKGTYSEVKLDRDTVFFGDVRVGGISNPAVTVSISNPGTAELKVQNLSVTGAFVVEHPALPILIPAGKDSSFSVKFKPSTQGAASGSITVLTDANIGGGGNTGSDGGVGSGGGAVRLTLHGNGTIAVANLSEVKLDFGKQHVHEKSGVQPVLITNNGQASLDITSFIFSNTVFAISEPNLNSLTIGAGETKPVPLAFTPNALGPVSGKLYLVSNAFEVPPPLELMGEGVDGQISMNPSVVSFAKVEVGSTGVEKEVELTNEGSYSLKLKTVAIQQEGGTPFRVSGLNPGLVLKPGDTWKFTIIFAPSTRGYVSGTLVIGSDAQINPTFNLALSGTGVAAAVELLPKEINFGKSNVGVTISQDISVKNRGELDLYVSNISFADETPDASGAALDFKTEVTFPVVVQPGKSAIVPLKFTPRHMGQREARAIFHTNGRSLDGTPTEATLLGEGTSPNLHLSATKLDFGNVLVGSPSTPAALTITNDGNGSLVVSALKLGGADATYFLMGPVALPITLLPGASTEVSLTLRPEAERKFSALLVVESNDTVGPSVPVTLEGVGVRQQIQLSESTLDFGWQLINSTSSSRKLRIKNSSSTKVTLSGLSLAGEGAAQFSLSTLALPLTLEGGTEAEVGLSFTPLAEAAVNGKLKITFSEPPLQLEADLRGRGVLSVLTVKPSPLDFGGVRAGGEKREQMLSLTNQTSDTIILTEPKELFPTGERFIFDGLSLKGLTIPPTGSIIVSVGYQPKVETLSESTLTFGTTTPNQPRAVDVQLKGRATALLLSVEPGNLDFGRVDVNKSVDPKVVTVTNKSAQQQRVVVKLSVSRDSPFALEAKALADPIPSGGSATFTVAFDPDKAGQAENEVQVLLQGETGLETEALIPVTGHGRALTGQGGGCSCGSTEAGSAGMLMLLAMVGLGSRRRKRE